MECEHSTAVQYTFIHEPHTAPIPCVFWRCSGGQLCGVGSIPCLCSTIGRRHPPHRVEWRGGQMKDRLQKKEWKRTIMKEIKVPTSLKGALQIE